jgi:hypothetical protein
VTEAAVALLREPSPPLAPLAICGGKLALCAPADHAAWMERLGGCLLPYAREAERVLFCGVECWRSDVRSQGILARDIARIRRRGSIAAA